MAIVNVGAHNMLFSLDPDRWHADLRKSSYRTHVCVYSEADMNGAGPTLIEHCKQSGRGLFYPSTTTNPISWRSNVFRPIKGQHGVREAYRARPRTRFNPGGDFAWQGLLHRETNERLLVIAVHPVAKALNTIDEPIRGGTLHEWKDWAIRQYWLDLLAFSAQQMGRIRKGGAPYWDALVVAGDWNARWKDDVWYYPAPLLSGLLVLDDRPKAIDHIALGRGMGSQFLRRWALNKGVHSDHPLHFARVLL